MIVLDTHALLWWIGQPSLLGPGARSAIRTADRIAVPTICFWETALLVRKRRVAVGMPMREWLAQVLRLPRVLPIELSARMAVAAEELSMHSDPADRVIVAAALELGAGLVTKDRLLRKLSFVRTIW